MSEGRERRVEKAQRDLQIAEALHGRGGGTVGHFDTHLHPRDRTGKWRETFTSPERGMMGQVAPRPKPQQEFARPFGGPQSTAMPPPDESPPATRVSRRGDERPNALSPEEHQFARGFGPIPTDTAGLREFRARVAERIAASPDDGGPRFRAQTRKLQASTVKKIDAAIRSGRGLIILQAPAAPAPAPRPDPYQARIDSIKAATGLDVTEPETSFLPFGSALSNDLHAMRAHAAERIQSSPDDGGPEFRRRARAAQKSLLAKIDAAIASGPVMGAPGSTMNPHPGASVTFTAKGKNNIPDRQVTGTSLGNGLAFVARNNPVVGTPEFTVYHIKHGIVMATIGAAGRDESRAKYAFQRHFAGLNANQTIEQMRADPGWMDKAQNLGLVIDATNTDVHRARNEARAAAGAAARERRVQDVMSGDRGQRTGAVVGGHEGRWLTIKGKKKHIPRGADWTHEDGAAKFDSPAGGTDVYRTGPDGVRELVSQPGQRGTHEDVRQIQHRSRGGAPAPAPAPAGYARGDRVSYNGLNLVVLGTRGDQVHVSNPGGTTKRWLPAADVTRGESRAPAAPLSDVSVPGQEVDSAAEQRRRNEEFTLPGRSRQDPVMAARIDALKAMSPGEHRLIDGAYVKREADNTYTVHHGFGSERYRTRNDVPGPGRNQGLGDYFATTRDARMSQLADVLRSIDQASQGAANAPNIMMTPMVQAGQMQSRMEVGDKVAVRWTGGGDQSGGNAVVKRINRASAVVTIDGGPQNGRDITVPLHDPGRQNRWSVNNRIIPRGPEIDRHMSRQESTPIRGDRLLQQATRDSGNRVTNAPREASGRIRYLVDGKGPFTAVEALAALGLPASGATPAEYEAWRRRQGLREADFSAGRRRKLAKRGEALPDGSFPIENLSQLKDAVQALGRAKDKVRAKRHIIKRAHALGCVSALPTDWKVQEAEMDARERRVMIEVLASDPALIALAEAHDKGAEPFSTSKTSNWVARAGGLPHYIQHIAHDLMEKRGMPESKAIAMAVGIVKRWARGGGNVKPDTRAAAAKAVAEWEAKRAKAHAA